MTSTFIHYVGAPPLTQTEAFQRVAEATAERKRRRDGWLKERREKLRERFRHTIIGKALKRQTERCAARRSGDPTLAAGRRLQAKINSDVRKAGVVKLRPNAPVKLRVPSMVSMPLAQLRAHKGQHFDCSEIGKEKSVKWHYNGKLYTQPELKKILDYEQKIRQIAETKLKGRKILQQSMAKLQTNLQQSITLRKDGVNASPKLKITHGTLVVPRSRQQSLRVWQHAATYQAQINAGLEQEAYYRRPSVIARRQPQAVAGFALPPVPRDEPMDIDKHKFATLIEDKDFVLPTIEEVNSTPIDTFSEALKHISHKRLLLAKNHLTTLRREGGGEGIDHLRWNALIGAISEAHQKESKNNKNNKNSNNSQHFNGKNGNNNQSGRNDSKGKPHQSNNNNHGGRGNQNNGKHQNNQHNGKGSQNNSQNNKWNNNGNNDQHGGKGSNKFQNGKGGGNSNKPSFNDKRKQGNDNFRNGKKAGKGAFIANSGAPKADTRNYGQDNIS